MILMNLCDISRAAESYFRAIGASSEAIAEAIQVKLIAERSMGKIWLNMPKQSGSRGIGKKVEGPMGPPTIRDLGIKDKSIRRARLLASLPEHRFEEVKSGKVTVQDIVREDNRKSKISAIKNVSLSGDIGRFPVIYCDPPWEYEHSVSRSREVDNHYPTMTTEKICELRIKDICQDDAVLFLWATSPKLTEALKVMWSWGFEYRTCAVWDKEIIGMGYYFRQQHELLLVGSKGDLPTPLPINRPPSVIRSRRIRHSEKPKEVYEIIEAMYPDLGKVEIFARAMRAGWKSWGNEI